MRKPKKITLKMAKKFNFQTVLHDNELRLSNGSCVAWRVNGQTRLWKRSPERIKIPLRHGLYDYGYLTEHNLHSVHLPEDCPRILRRPAK